MVILHWAVVCGFGLSLFFRSTLSAPDQKDLQRYLEGSVFGLELREHVVIKGVSSPPYPQDPYWHAPFTMVILQWAGPVCGFVSP